MDHTPTLQAALDAFDHGFEVVLFAESSKRPKLAGWTERVMERTEIAYWIERYRLNYGLRLGRTGVCVLDKDGRSAVTSAFLEEHGAHSPMEVLTPHAGRHGYFRIPLALTAVRTRIKWLGLGLDVKLTGAACGPGSVIDGAVYRLKARGRLVHRDELPPLPASLVALLNAAAAPPPARVVPAAGGAAAVARVRNYVRHIVARCHHRAHDQAYRCACRIADTVPDFALAMEIYREWNATNAVAEDGTTPYPFSEAELMHKMQDAFKRSRKA